jgi:hypothetical protein
MTILSGLLWFFAGIMFNKAFTTIADFGLLSKAVEKVTNDLLISLVFIEQDIQFVMESRKLILKERGMTELEIENLSLLHDKSFRVWREKVIITLINNYPSAFKERYLPFNNWAGAALYVNQMIKLNKVANKQ